MAATAKALNTTEILEHILMCLSARDLLLSQRVAVLWQDLVETRDEFQRRLFRKPVTKAEQWTSVVDCSTHKDDASFSIRAISPVSATGLHYVEDMFLGAWVMVEPNPLLDLSPYFYEYVERCAHREKEDDFSNITGCDILHNSYDRCTIRRTIPLDNTHPEMLRMFLTQPPAQRITINYRDGAGTERFEVVLNMDGIPLGDVLKKLKTKMPDWDRVSNLDIAFINCLFMRDNLRGVIDAGIKRFHELESKIGIYNALRIVVRTSVLWEEDLSLLLRQDNLDK